MTNTTTFVVQLHLAKKSGKHFDFRIKSENVLKSWAIPKARFPNKGERLLAVQTPDHPLYWETFKGKIVSGYGKGEVFIHDSGTCDILQWKRDKIGFILKGRHIKGTFWLIRIANKKSWMLLRSK